MLRHKLICSVFVMALVGAMNTPTFAKPQKNRQATFGNLIAALNNVNVQINRLLTDFEIGDITVVDARNLLQGARINALNNALRNANIQIDVLRDAVIDIEVLQNALQNANILITDVIAVDVLSGGDIIIFHVPGGVGGL